MDKLMEELTTMIAGTFAIINTIEKQHSVLTDALPYEMKTLSSVMNAIENETNDRTRFIKINVGIAIMYQLMTKNEDFRFMFETTFKDIMALHEDKFKEFKNYKQIYSSVNEIGIYKVMDNLINSVSV